MTRDPRLTLVRFVHTAIYAIMVLAIFAVLFAGVTGRHGPWLWVALGLVIAESLVFLASGMKCPLTAVAVKYGATPSGAYDTFMPERLTRHTLTVFGPLLLLGVGLVALRGWRLGWDAPLF